MEEDKSLDIPYPAGHNWAGLTPRQVSAAYERVDPIKFDRLLSDSERQEELATEQHQQRVALDEMKKREGLLMAREWLIEWMKTSLKAYHRVIEEYSKTKVLRKEWADAHKSNFLFLKDILGMGEEEMKLIVEEVNGDKESKG